MKLFDIIKRANQNLLRSKLRTFLTIGALVVGSVTLSLMIAIGEGVKSFIDTQMALVSGENAMVILDIDSQQGGGGFSITEPQEYTEEVPSQQGLITISEEDIERIEQIDGIKIVQPLTQLNPEYITRDGEKKYEIRLTGTVEAFSMDMVAGTPPTIEDEGGVILSYSFLKPLGFETAEESIGEKVSVVFKNPLGEELEKELEIKSIIPNSILNAGSSYVTYKDALEINDFQTKNTPLEGRFLGAAALVEDGITQDPEKVKALKEDLNEEGFWGQTLDDQVKLITDLLTVVQMVLAFFGVLVIFASTFGIINTLLMSVFERTKEIGLMRAIGMKRTTVFTIFSLEAVSIGFWGGIVGLIIAQLIGKFVNDYILKNNFLGFEGTDLLVFPLKYMFAVIAALMVISFLAGVLPSLKASRMDPIKALRYE